MARKVSKDKKLRNGPQPLAKSLPKKDVKANAKDKGAKGLKGTVVAAKTPPKNGKPALAAKSAAKPAKEAEAAKDLGKKKDGGKPPVGEGAKGSKSKDGALSKSKDAAKPKDAPPKRKRKSSVVRLKAYWGVFNQMLKRVAVFEYDERKQADKKAAELSTSAKQPHFVQLVKEVIRDED